MPAISSISFAARHCEMGRIIGIPPPTDASNRKYVVFVGEGQKLIALLRDKLLV